MSRKKLYEGKAVKQAAYRERMKARRAGYHDRQSTFMMRHNPDLIKCIHVDTPEQKALLDYLESRGKGDDYPYVSYHTLDELRSMERSNGNS